MAWLVRSIDAGRGGSAAYFAPLFGWSRPYPETSGYLIPTLLEAAIELQEDSLRAIAVSVGEWLLTLQQEDGWWAGGLYKQNQRAVPSVFNTGQIVFGMAALARCTGEARWGRAVLSAVEWLARGVDEQGVWLTGNYRPGFNPSYYTHVAWPMLIGWQLGAGEVVRAAAVRVLKRVAARRAPNGVIRGWSFEPAKAASTHTIAYTLRGLIESAILLNDWGTFGSPCEAALERFARAAEFARGRLPGSYYEDWRPVKWYTCVTGNAQIALCLLRFEEQFADLRLVNAAAKLVDYVCSKQRVTGGRPATHGAVAGSWPLWGRYMCLRYPNWAAKFHAEALMVLIRRLRREGLE